MDVVATSFAIRNVLITIFNYKILEFLIIINGVFVECMLSELLLVVFNSNSSSF